MKGERCMDTQVDRTAHILAIDRLRSRDLAPNAAPSATDHTAWILRLVERLGRTSSGVLRTTLGNDPEFAETDLMEWNAGSASRFSGGKAELTLKPFEIRTLQIVPESAK